MMGALIGCQERRTPVVYEIPEGFRGWVLIQFNKPECPRLAEVEGKLVLRISKDGKSCASSAPEYGWAKDEFHFVSERGREPIRTTVQGGGGMIWSASIGECGSGAGHTAAVFSNFYVGTEVAAKADTVAPSPPECQNSGQPAGVVK
jgi:hypothetical protein